MRMKNEKAARYAPLFPCEKRKAIVINRKNFPARTIRLGSSALPLLMEDEKNANRYIVQFIGGCGIIREILQ